MIQLFIDTSQPYLLLGLKNGSRVFETLYRHDNQLGAKLSSEVQVLFITAGLDFKDLQEIRVGVGPGSYTGTRVGIAFAESLGFGLDIPVIKVPSLLFFLKKGETSLIFNSKFDTCGYLSIDDVYWNYEVIPLSHTLESAPRILDMNTFTPCPYWELIGQIQAKKALSTPLYFNLV
jgi:tRNA threonylcarbamoyl adenosine modification protein YeaZ